MKRLSRQLAASAVLLSVIGARAGQEALNQPPPTTAAEATTPIEAGIKPGRDVEHLNMLNERMRRALQDAPAFVRDTELKLKPRTYYYVQKKPDDKTEQAWAAGGSISYRSGWLAERFRLGAELYTSQPLYAPEDEDSTLLLAPGQAGYTVLGQAYGQLRLWDNQLLSAGRRELNTPYANPQFNRMTPITFEQVTLEGKFTGLLQHHQFHYLAGYLSKIKLRNADTFVPMSQPVGLGAEDGGTYFAHLLFSVWGASIGLAEYYTPHNFNILYGEASYTPATEHEWGIKLSAQYTSQRSVAGSSAGSNMLLSRNGGARAVLSYKHSVLTLAGSKTASDGQVISIWGSNPSYTAAAIKNTNRANESAVLLHYSYEFGRIGIPGLSLNALYARYWDARDPSTGQRLQNEYEYDLILDYQIRGGPFHGLSFRLQHDVLRGSGDPEATRDIRVILNWRVALM